MIPQRYTNATAVLIGNGPSLTTHQVALCQQPHARGHIVVMGCNDAYRICSFLDVLYAGDGRWIDHHRGRILATSRQANCQYWTPDEKAAAAYEEWCFVKHKPERGLSTDREIVHSGNHSGFQLINVAYLMGCSRIVLIGYDCKSGGQHWFGEHPQGPLRVKSNFDRWRAVFKPVADQAPGLSLTIVNATIDSAIDAFRRVDLAEALLAFEERSCPA